MKGRTDSFGYWLRRRRKALDLTQKMLAGAVSCSEDAIRKIEADERRPSRRLSERLADRLGIAEGERGRFLDAARAVRGTDQLGMDDEPQEVARALSNAGPIANGVPTAASFDGYQIKQDIRFARSVDGVRIAYATCGGGYPLIRPAHWLTNIEHDLRTPLFGPFIAAMARRFTYIRNDPRGGGLSDREITDRSLDAFVHDIEAVADASGFERFALLGTSGGSPPAIAYAARHPDRVSHLILIGAFARGVFRRPNLTPEDKERWATSIKLIELGWGQNNPAFLQLFTSQLFPTASLEQQRSFNELQRTSATPQEAAAIATAISEFDVTRELGGVRCPTLVIHCEGDARVPIEEGRLIAASVPNARFVPLATNNHTPLPGEPTFAQMFELLDAFLPARPQVNLPR